jgi:hypothetical protein
VIASLPIRTHLSDRWLGSVLLGVVLALAHLAWFSLNSDKLGDPIADVFHVALIGLAVLGWSLVVACGVICLATSHTPRIGIAGIAAASAAAAAITALCLLANTASGDYLGMASSGVAAIASGFVWMTPTTTPYSTRASSITASNTFARIGFTES